MMAHFPPVHGAKPQTGDSRFYHLHGPRSAYSRSLHQIYSVRIARRALIIRVLAILPATYLSIRHNLERSGVSGRWPTNSKSEIMHLTIAYSPKVLPWRFGITYFETPSTIQSTDEFSTKARLHNRIVWDLDYDENDARVDAGSLDEALRTRGKIVLVCKAWYAMGIEILYSHMRIKGTLCDDMAFYGLLTDCCRLLHYTRRLTLAPPPSKKSLPISPTEHLRRAAWLCTGLPRLQILTAPGDLMASFTLESLPKTLEVVVFNDSSFHISQPHQTNAADRPLPAVWMNVRVLNVSSYDLLLCTRIHSHVVTFNSLEDLSFRKSGEWFGEAHDEVVEYICESWRAPKLRGFLLCEPNAFHWKKLLVYHAESLEILCINTWGHFDRRSDDGLEKEVIDLPNLKALYIDWWEDVPVFVANELQRVGIHDLGAYSPEEPEEEQEIARERLEDVYIRWHMYPKITSCCITGWEGIIGWLEKQPQEVDFVTKMKERGVEVTFIGMEGDASVYGDN